MLFDSYYLMVPDLLFSNTDCSFHLPWTQDSAVPSAVPIEATHTAEGALGDDVKGGDLSLNDLTCNLSKVSELLAFCLSRSLCFSRLTNMSWPQP